MALQRSRVRTPLGPDKFMSKLIVFEGIDGVGKTTHLNATCDFLNNLEIPHLKTLELNGEDVRKQIRSILMENPLDVQEELMCLSLARRWHGRQILKPALEEGKVVLMDRFVESTWAYQVGGRGLAPALVEFCQAHLWEVPEPDLTIYLYGKQHRQAKFNRFDYESTEFFAKVDTMYRSRIGPTWLCLDSSEAFAENQGRIETCIKKMLVG